MREHAPVWAADRDIHPVDDRVEYHEARIDLAERLEKLYELIYLIDQSLAVISTMPHQPLEFFYTEEPESNITTLRWHHWQLEWYGDRRIYLRSDGVVVYLVRTKDGSAELSKRLNLTDLTVGQIQGLIDRIKYLVSYQI